MTAALLSLYIIPILKKLHYKKTWCIGPYVGVDYNSLYLIVNTLVIYLPPLQKERGGLGKIKDLSSWLSTFASVD